MIALMIRCEMAFIKLKLLTTRIESRKAQPRSAVVTSIIRADLSINITKYY